MEFEQIKRVIEALIFASDLPLSIDQLKQNLEVEDDLIKSAIKSLQEDYFNQQHAFIISKVAGGYQFSTQPEFARWIKRLYEGRSQTRLSRAALETLAIIAFKQPICRSDIVAIRGVNSDGVIRHLLSRNLIDIAGRSEIHARSLLYKTTDQFLRYFGVNDLSDLPRPREIEELVAAGEVTGILAELQEREREVIQKGQQEADTIDSAESQDTTEVKTDSDTVE